MIECVVICRTKSCSAVVVLTLWLLQVSLQLCVDNDGDNSQLVRMTRSMTFFRLVDAIASNLKGATTCSASRCSAFTTLWLSILCLIEQILCLIEQFVIPLHFSVALDMISLLH